MANVTDMVRYAFPEPTRLGKFYDDTDEFIYWVAMDGNDYATLGYEDGSWVGVVDIDGRTDGYIAFIARAAVVMENSFGTVYVWYFDDMDEAIAFHDEIYESNHVPDDREDVL